MPSNVIPSGVVRPIPTGQVLFSTTDRRGIITGTNAQFAQISGYESADLIGELHNAVRHPEMPGGLFRMIWDRLESNRLVAAYIQNLAADGASYWTFATIVPVGTDRFLSVRTEVSHPEHHAMIAQIYAKARAAERKMTAGGMSVPDAAAESSRVIEGLVTEQGYSSYDAIVADTLPAEIALWAKAPRPPLPAAITREGHEIGRVLSASKVIDEEIEVIRAQLSDYLLLAHELGEQSESLQPAVGNLARVVAVAAQASEQVAGSAPVLVRAASAAASLAQEASVSLETLPGLLTAARADLLALRQYLAVAVLHNAAAESFAIDIARGEAPGEAMASLGVLCEALENTVGHLDAEWADTGRILLDVADTIERVGNQLADFQRMLLDWRNLVIRFRLSGALSSMLSDVDQQETRTRARVVAFRALTEKCRGLVKPLPAARLHDSVAALKVS